MFVCGLPVTAAGWSLIRKYRGLQSCQIAATDVCLWAAYDSSGMESYQAVSRAACDSSGMESYQEVSSIHPFVLSCLNVCTNLQPVFEVFNSVICKITEKD